MIVGKSLKPPFSISLVVTILTRKNTGFVFSQTILSALVWGAFPYYEKGGLKNLDVKE